MHTRKAPRPSVGGHTFEQSTNEQIEELTHVDGEIAVFVNFDPVVVDIV